MAKYHMDEVVVVEGVEYIITNVPTRSNAVNYKMMNAKGELFKIRGSHLDFMGKVVRTDSAWGDKIRNGQTDVRSGVNASTDKLLVAGDEVKVVGTSSQEIENKIAYVVKVNAKTVQIVIPHVGTWNVSRNLLVAN